MKVAYTPRALRDIEAIAAYLVERSPRGALRARTAILETLQLVSRFPLAGRRQTLPGVRKIRTTRYPYLVYYRIDLAADEILVLTIRHSARRRVARDT